MRALLEAAGASVPLTAPGLDLSRLDCSREALATLAGDDGVPVWRDGESGGLALTGAELPRARLDDADLSGANLRRATLTGAVGRSARFAGAILEEADLTESDLSGADFTGIVAGQILVTPQDTEERRRYLNARSTVQKLLELRAAPWVRKSPGLSQPLRRATSPWNRTGRASAIRTRRVGPTSAAGAWGGTMPAHRRDQLGRSVTGGPSPSTAIAGWPTGSSNGCAITARASRASPAPSSSPPGWGSACGR